MATNLIMRVIDLWEGGETAAQISAHLDITPLQVYTILGWHLNMDSEDVENAEEIVESVS